jgi:hypothetical protein
LFVIVIFQALTAANMKCRVFWDVAPCSHVEADRLFNALMMEAVRTSETLAHFNMTTGRYIPEDSTRHCLCLLVFYVTFRGESFISQA